MNSERLKSKVIDCEKLALLLKSPQTLEESKTKHEQRADAGKMPSFYWHY